MKDIFNANISHSFFYTAPYESIDEFVAQVRQNWPNAIGYALNEKQDHPYLVDMQTAERFLKGGSQTYQVKRFFLTDDDKIDLEKSGLAAYAHGEYFELGKKIGKFGFSATKKKKGNNKR